MMLFSIIVPIYNVEKYLARCIDSILDQDYANYEIILVNDGSTDNSLLIAEKYSKKYSNIILINKENGGLSDARNVGLDTAKGQYVIFLDSDDAIDKNALKTINCALENQEDIDVLAGEYKEIFSDKVVIQSRYSNGNNNSTITGVHFLKEQLTHKRMYMNAWAKK